MSRGRGERPERNGASPVPAAPCRTQQARPGPAGEGAAGDACSQSLAHRARKCLGTGHLLQPAVPTAPGIQDPAPELRLHLSSADKRRPQRTGPGARRLGPGSVISEHPLDLSCSLHRGSCPCSWHAEGRDSGDGAGRCCPGPRLSLWARLRAQSASQPPDWSLVEPVTTGPAARLPAHAQAPRGEVCVPAAGTDQTRSPAQSSQQLRGASLVVTPPTSPQPCPAPPNSALQGPDPSPQPGNGHGRRARARLTSWL